MERGRWVGAVVAVSLVVAACSSSSGGSTAKLDSDAQSVSAEVQNVLVALGLAIKSPTTDNVDQLAQTAQAAHDQIDSDKTAIAVDSSGSNGDLFGAADELKNAMGALVAYTGNPNPATLAHFNSQYDTAVTDWNAAVLTLWKQQTGTPPTVPTGGS